MDKHDGKLILQQDATFVIMLMCLVIDFTLLRAKPVTVAVYRLDADSFARAFVCVYCGGLGCVNTVLALYEHRQQDICVLNTQVRIKG